MEECYVLAIWLVNGFCKIIKIHNFLLYAYYIIFKANIKKEWYFNIDTRIIRCKMKTICYMWHKALYFKYFLTAEQHKRINRFILSAESPQLNTGSICYVIKNHGYIMILGIIFEYSMILRMTWGAYIICIKII